MFRVVEGPKRQTLQNIVTQDEVARVHRSRNTLIFCEVHHLLKGKSPNLQENRFTSYKPNRNAGHAQSR